MKRVTSNFRLLASRLRHPRPVPLAPLRGKAIGLIGAGHMGQALLRGLRAAGVPGRALLVVEPRLTARRAAARRHGARPVSLGEAARRCQVLLVAVKPQEALGVLEELGQSLGRRASRRPLIISIAAGLRLRALSRRLGRAGIVRVMPNLAATVGASISAMTFGQGVTTRGRALARAILGCVGQIVELPERLFDAVTAISGSGPAYFFVVCKALRDAAVQAGIPAEVARRLVVQTALGSARLADGSGAAFDELINRVASKRGTTEAALRVFRRRGLNRILQAGVRAAERRSRELSSPT